ncbi:MAG: tRNA (guanosine(37)-N1)-methyltransferase TrmD [Chloroflexota bacterium]
MTLRLDVITIFPGMFPGPLGESIPGRALARGLAELHVHDLRDWGLGRHKSVDDYPYGGGAGMVMRPEPIGEALDAVAPPGTARRILMDPGGRRFDQALARELAEEPWLVFVCPRYEGVDDRIRTIVDTELSIGDYVLSGGELPALVVMDAVLRLLPGAIDEASPIEESFSEGLLEYPQFTRPPEWRGLGIPEVLTSGHHGEVARWRHAQALERTRRVRPDLLAATGPGGDGAPADALYSATDRQTRAPRDHARRRPPADHDTRK